MKKENNHIITLQEKCGFINRVLVFIDEKIKNKQNNSKTQLVIVVR